MTSLPEDVRPVCGLLDGYDWFNRVDGADSQQAREELELLLSTMKTPVTTGIADTT
jgi:hypothetical protein